MPPDTFTLDRATDFRPYIIHSVDAPLVAPEWQAWLEEIGFIPGEQVKVLARSLPGGDPLVVRVGTSTFALRRVEAACIHVKTIEAKASLDASRIVAAVA